MNKLEQVLFDFRNELGSDFMSTDVVGMDGISIAGGSIDPNFNANDAAARFAEVMKLAFKISTKIEIGKVEDNLVTTDKTYILSRFLGDGSYYWVVVVTSNATLGTVRMLMNEYASKIWDVIPHEVASPASAPLEEKVTGSKTQEKTKEEKPKRNFWADAKSKGDDQSNKEDEEKALKMYKFP